MENQIKIAESIVSQYESETPPYPASLWDAFISAFKSAKDLVAKPGYSNTSEEAKAAKKALEDARVALTSKTELVDVSSLENAINAAKKINQADYTEQSYKALQTALTNAEAVFLKADTATKAEVDEVTQALLTATNNLVLKNASTDTEVNPGGLRWWVVLIIIVGIIAIGAVAVIFILKNKRAAKAVDSGSGEEVISEDQESDQSISQLSE